MKERAERKIRNKKVMIALMEYIVTLGCLLVAFVMISGKNIKQTSSYAKPEEVSRYQVEEDKYLTRVRPLTEYETFKEIAERSLNKEIVVYNNADKTEKVQEGIITSGMILEEKNEGTSAQMQSRSYIISVVGDLNSNGNCDVTELTKIIRNIIGLDVMKEKADIISADFNDDGIIDVVDITMCIRYIVYGELPADLNTEPEPKPQPEPEPVDMPEVVVTGEGNTDWYRTDVKVEIVEDGDNIEKTISRFEINLTGEEETKVISTKNKKILLREEGKYKIATQSYGKDGGKSEVVSKEINIDKTKPILNLSREDIDKTSCKIVINGTDDNGIIKYSVKKEDGEVIKSEATSKKELNEELTINEDGKYKVIVEDLAGNITEEEIEIKGVSTRYIVTFKNEDESIISEKEYLDEETIEMPQIPTKQEDNTYTYEFAGWKTTNEDGQEVIVTTEEIANGTVSGNKEYIATYKKIYINYTVTFKNDDGSIIISKDDYHYGDDLILPENPTKQEDNTYTYEFSGWNPNISTEVVNNVEYIAQYEEKYKEYNIRFLNEDQSEISSKNYHYGDKLLLPENPIKQEDEIYTYEFKGWKDETGEIIELTTETEVTTNKEFIAVYEAKYREYTITFWNEDKTQVIYSQTFTAVNKQIQEPEITQDREGYICYWTYYDVELKDIDVQLYYVEEKSYGETLTETIDGITWIGKYQDGKATNVYYESGELEEIVRIPATLEGYPVESLCGSNVYNYDYFNLYQRYIKEIILPKTVNSIGDNVFGYCVNLTKIELINIKNIGNNAFRSCYNLTEIEIPNVISIGSYAFYSCNLRKVEISDTVQNIANEAFKQCDSLVEINVDNNNENYSSEEGVLFNKDKSILIQYPAKKENNSYKIPNTVTSIGMSAFYDCNKLTSIEIPNSVISIGDSAFYYCYNLTNIEIPVSVTNIGSNAFNECHNLSDIDIDNREENITLGQNWNYRAFVHFNDCMHSVTFTNAIDGIHIEEIENPLENGKIECGKTYQFKLINDSTNEVEKGKVSIITSQGKMTDYVNTTENLLPDENGVYTIKNINRNKSITLSDIQNGMTIQYKIDGITWECTIQDENAENVHYIDGELGENVEIPAELNGYKVVRLYNNGRGIFYKDGENYGKQIKTIQIPNSINAIKDGALSNCTNLKVINIPNSVTKIGYSVFKSCISLTDIYIDNFEDNLSISDNLNSFGYVHFKDCKHDISFENYINRELTIETVGENGQDGHIECNKDYKFKLLDREGNAITTEKVLVKYEKLENTEEDYRRMLEEENLLSSMFANEEEGIRELKVGEDGIYKINNIHRNVTIIIGSYEIEDENQIKWNYNIKDGKAINVYYAEGPLQETVVIPAKIDGYPVENLYNKEESGNIFANAEDASVIKNVILQNGITKIGKFAFYKLQNLETIQIPNSVTDIGFAAFYNCENLKEIEIPSSISNIKPLTFCKCTGLQNIKMSNGITEIGIVAFARCINLKNIELSNSLKSIKDYAFLDCYNIKTIDIPDSVIDICTGAFFGCKELNNINMQNVISIGERAFSDCVSLEYIKIPKSVTKLDYPFYSLKNIRDVYIDNTYENIQIMINQGNHWNYGWESNQDVQIHYKDCEHSITFKNYTDENVNIDFINKDINYEKVPCGSTIQFKLLKDDEIVRNRTLYIYEFNTTNNIETKREIQPNENGIYTIDNINRDITLAVGERYRHAVDSKGIMWEYTYENGNATNVHYYTGKLNSTVEIPSRLNNYPVVSLYNEKNKQPIGIFGDNNYSVTKTTIPNGVTSIGENAFYNCTNLSNLEISESVIDVGKNAFEGTRYYNNLPNGEIYIGKALYKYKGNMPWNTNLVIREGTESVSEDAFKNCNNLNSIVFPDSMKKIEKNAFYQSGQFITINMPKITYIGDNAFSNCNYLADIYIDNEESNITLGKNWNHNAYVHFKDCMQDVNVINEFTDITVQEVGNNLVNGKIRCGETYQFKIINNGDYIPTIRETTEGEYTNSTTQTQELIPDENGIYTINNIKRNKTIRIGKTNGTQLQAEDENGITWNYTYQDGNATNVYYESGKLGAIVNIPSELDGYSVISLSNSKLDGQGSIFANEAWEPNRIVEIVKVPNSVTYIHYNAFENCPNLSDYYIDSEDENFYNNMNFTRNNGYTHYKNCAHTVLFNLNSEDLKAIDYETGNEIQDISVACGTSYKFKLINKNDGAVIYNKKLFSNSEGKYHHSAYSLTILEPDEEGIYTIKDINRNKTVIENITNGTKVISTDENNITWQFTYQNGKAENVHYYDGELKENVEIPSSLHGYQVVSLYNDITYGSIFAKNSDEINEIIKKINIPNTVTIIGDRAFRNCRGLCNVNIPNSVNTIKSDAFDYCINLKVINIPNSVIKIESSVFYGCISLSDIYIDNLEESITLSDDLNQYGYVHYKECKHDISYEKYSNEDITLQTVGEQGQDGHIECNEKYQFKLVDNNGNPVITEKVLVRYAGLENEIDEDANYYDRVRRLLDNLSNMFSSEEEGIRELQAGEDGIYTVEKVHRNITIIVGSYQATDENNITWNYSIKNGKAINVYYAGGKLGETVEIPSELDGHQVVTLYNKEESGNIFAKTEDTSVIKNVVIQNGIIKIDKYAFYKLGSLETITIPESVTETGYASFYNCENLKEINIPENLTKIGGWAFANCSGLTNIQLPNSVTEIGKAAFSTCKNLESIRLPSNLALIEDNLFINCEKLNNIEIPDEITTIGNRAFNNCSSLENLVIPDTVTEIKEYAFNGCSNLKNVKLSNSISILEDSLFMNCISLTEITIPSSVTEIKNNVFSWCTSLTNIDIHANVTKIAIAFSGCTSLKDIYIDNYETDITMGTYEGKPWYPWYGQINAQIHYKDCIHSVKLRKYMEDNTEIESVDERIDNENIPCRSNYQFRLVKDGEVIKNKSMTIVELGITRYYNVEKEIEPDENGIYTIENISRDYIIEIGDKYQQATDEKGITWEYEYEDGKATNVHYYSGEFGTNIEIPGTLNGYQVVSLYKEDSTGNPSRILGENKDIIVDVIIPEGVTSIGKSAFDNYYNLSTIKLPNSMKYIGSLAFTNCFNLKNINLPDNIKEIGNQAFYYCSSLESIELPSKLTVIEENLFNSCNNLKNITIKNNVKEIKNSAFAYCVSLERLDIPEGVTTIENNVFNNCVNLSTITIPDSINTVYDYCSIDNTPYYNNLPNGEFYMGKVLYSYKGKEQMSENTIIRVKDGTEVIKKYTFEKITNLIGIELPDSVTTIEECAFKECTNLSYVEMSKNIKYIGGGAFQDCINLTEIVIWKNVEKLRDRAFERWTNEQTINFEVEEVQEGWEKDWNKDCNAQIVFGYTGE